MRTRGRSLKRLASPVGLSPAQSRRRQRWNSALLPPYMFPGATRACHQVKGLERRGDAYGGIKSTPALLPDEPVKVYYQEKGKGTDISTWSADHILLFGLSFSSATQNNHACTRAKTLRIAIIILFSRVRTKQVIVKEEKKGGEGAPLSVSRLSSPLSVGSQYLWPHCSLHFG